MEGNENFSRLPVRGKGTAIVASPGPKKRWVMCCFRCEQRAATFLKAGERDWVWRGEESEESLGDSGGTDASLIISMMGKATLVVRCARRGKASRSRGTMRSGKRFRREEGKSPREKPLLGVGVHRGGLTSANPHPVPGETIGGNRIEKQGLRRSEGEKK